MLAKAVMISALVAVATADFHSQYMLRKWAYKKAVENCIGEENVENYMIKKRQAVAKCSQQQAPELDLPIFQQPYRSVGAMVESAMARPSYSAYNKRLLDESQSDSWIDNAMRKYFLRQMLKRLERLDDDNEDLERRDDNEEDRRDEDNLFGIFEANNRPKHGLRRVFINRFARETEEPEEQEEKDSEIGVLSEKLTEKLEREQVLLEELIGNYTCVLREGNIIDDENQLREQGIVDLFEKEMNIEDEWLKNKLVKAARTCVQFAQSLPESVLSQMGEGFLSDDLNILISFRKCMRNLKLKTCRNFDIKQKLEKHFGPLQQMVERTGLKEENLLPFVMKMLHGGQDMEKAEKLF